MVRGGLRVEPSALAIRSHGEGGGGEQGWARQNGAHRVHDADVLRVGGAAHAAGGVGAAGAGGLQVGVHHMATSAEVCGTVRVHGLLAYHNMRS